MYYKIPLAFENIFNNKNLVLCSLGESIAQQIQLIIETRYGEHQGDMNFGCEIWSFDFELMIKVEDYEHRLRKSLLRTIIKYEPRLTDIDLNITITDEEVYNSLVGSREMKKQASIIVHATVQESSQPFYFKTVFHLNPVISV